MKMDEINRIESESGIIATLIHHPEYVFYSENLLPQHFTDTENKYVYTAICELAKQGITSIDPYNILEVLSQIDASGKHSETLTVDKLNELVDMSYVLDRQSVEEYKLLVSNVLDAAFRREMYKTLQGCQKLCLTGSPADDCQQKIYQSIDEVISAYSKAEEIPQYADVIDSLWEEIQSRQGDGYSGIPFKFPVLNEYVTIEQGELIIFGAQQKVGKSIMLLNCAVDLLRQEKSVLYIDSELSSRHFTARLLSHISGVEYRKLTSGNYTKEEETKILEAKEWMKTRKFTHLYMPFFDAQGIYTAVRRQHNLCPIDVIVIDYFKSTGNEADAFQTYAAMGRCVDLVKNEIAGAMNIAAIGAAQATVNNKLADSAKIARNASTIIMLMDKTQEEMEADGEECGNKKMVVTINRNGMQHATGEYIDLWFDGNHISYEQAKQHIPQSPF